MRFDKKTVSLGIMTQAIFKSFAPKLMLLNFVDSFERPKSYDKPEKSYK